MELELIILCAFAFFAGFVDSIAGGGGLIQLPALMLGYPHLDPLTMLGTNKASSVVGTSAAVIRYSRKVSIPWDLILPATLVAFLFSFFGAKTVELFPSGFLRPVMIVLLILVFLHTTFVQNFGVVDSYRKRTKRILAWSLLGAAVIGFYDGFFGPGTGGFLIYLLVWTLKLDLLRASASSKIINWGTNIAALIFFGSTGHVDLSLAIPMGVFNLMGGFVGSGLAIKKGVKLIQFAFRIVVVITIGRLVVQYLNSGRM